MPVLITLAVVSPAVAATLIILLRHPNLAPDQPQTTEGTFTLTYFTGGRQVRRDHLSTSRVETIGTLLARATDVCDIAVLDEAGQDVTFDFACFQA